MFHILSFNGKKTITISGGGALVTANEDEWREYGNRTKITYPQ